MMTDKGFQILRKLLNNGISQQTCMFSIFQIEQDLRIYELLKKFWVFAQYYMSFGDAETDGDIETMKNSILP